MVSVAADRRSNLWLIFARPKYCIPCDFGDMKFSNISLLGHSRNVIFSHFELTIDFLQKLGDSIWVLITAQLGVYNLLLHSSNQITAVKHHMPRKWLIHGEHCEASTDRNFCCQITYPCLPHPFFFPFCLLDLKRACTLPILQKQPN